jgi:hypothetical protein
LREAVVIKQLSFVRRAAGVDEAAFGQSWREHVLQLHGAMPPARRPWRVEHGLIRGRRESDRWHGIAFGWFEDETALRAWSERDAIEGLIDPASMRRVRVEERCAFGQRWMGERRSSNSSSPVLLLLGFIQRSSALDRIGFRDYWWSRHRPFANTVIPPQLQPTAYVHDYVQPGEDFAWDGIGEMYETDAANARARGAWFDSAAAAPLADDELQFMRRDTRNVVVTTHEIVV